MDYSSIAVNYDRFEKDDKTLLLLGYPAIIQFLVPPRDKKILDYGCGTGMFCRHIRDKGARVTGVDISKGMIDEAKKISPDGISYHRITSGNLGQFGGEVFDHVVSNFVFCAIPTIPMIKKILKEIFRVLKDQGLFILMNTNWERSNGREFVSCRLEYCDKLTSGNRIRVITKSDPPIIFEDYFRSKHEYQSLIEEVGFSVEAVEESLAPPDDPAWLDERQYPPYFIIVARKKA